MCTCWRKGASAVLIAALRPFLFLDFEGPVDVPWLHEASRTRWKLDKKQMQKCFSCLPSIQWLWLKKVLEEALIEIMPWLCTTPLYLLLISTRETFESLPSVTCLWSVWVLCGCHHSPIFRWNLAAPELCWNPQVNLMYPISLTPLPLSLMCCWFHPHKHDDE